MKINQEAQFFNTRIHNLNHCHWHGQHDDRASSCISINIKILNYLERSIAKIWQHLSLKNGNNWFSKIMIRWYWQWYYKLSRNIFLWCKNAFSYTGQFDFFHRTWHWHLDLLVLHNELWYKFQQHMILHETKDYQFREVILTTAGKLKKCAS
jgi:hypothetical protein